MKRVYITLFLSVWAIAISAQHYFGVTAGLSAAWQFDNIDKTTSGFGGGGEIGAIYQWHKGKFLLQTGLELDINYSMLGIDTIQFSFNMLDTEGMPFVYRGVVSDRVDRMSATELSLPLMVGCKVSSFYALVGAKLVCPLAARTCQTALLTSYGDYNGMFYEDFFDMPAHGYVSDQLGKNIVEANFLCDMRLCVELGGNFKLSTSYDNRLSIGLFAEYGLLNTLKNGNYNLVNVDASKNMNILSMYHIYTTLSRNSAFLNNLHVGLRFSFLFPIGGVDVKDKKM